MNYEQAIQYIESLAPTLEMPSLSRIATFLDDHGAPQDEITTLHVGGTNGKGSTTAILDSILRAAGLKTARFTGPHLLRWNERFHIGGLPIDDTEFAKRVSELKGLSERFAEDKPELGALTWFEFLTALAFFYFAQNQVDVAVIEVGLGGRFDATNAITHPLAVGITNVSYDHTHILGDTLEKIAMEKAGIIKRNVPVITACQPPALAIIQARAQELDAPLTNVNNADTRFARFLSGNVLRGLHQRLNALVALQMLKDADLPVDDLAIEKGLDSVYWPGRLQVLQNERLILDGAHNLGAAQALRSSLDQIFAAEKLSFVFACYGNKDGALMLKTLLRPGDRLYVSEAQSTRACYPKETLARHAQDLGVKVSIHETIDKALKQSVDERDGSQYVVATGSLAVVKEVMLALGWKRVEDGLSSRIKHGENIAV